MLRQARADEVHDPRRHLGRQLDKAIENGRRVEVPVGDEDGGFLHHARILAVVDGVVREAFSCFPAQCPLVSGEQSQKVKRPDLLS